MTNIRYPVSKLNFVCAPVVATAAKIIGDENVTVPTPEMMVLFEMRKMSCRVFGVMTHVDPLSIKTGYRPGLFWILKHRKISSNFSR
jgi:hypothetical protein